VPVTANLTSLDARRRNNIKIDLTTLTAAVETRLKDETDSGGTPWTFVVLRFGDAEVIAWPLLDGEQEQYENRIDWAEEERRDFLERFVADRLGAVLRGVG
jgi:hypothetical protein